MIVKINTLGNFMMFKHMNQATVVQFKRRDITPNMTEHQKMFEQTHGVRVIVKNSRWWALEFPTEQDYLMATLKWR